jgi:hypothetical protein
MEIFIGSEWNEYTDEFSIDEDAIFLNEEDAKAWVEESQKKLVQARIDERNNKARDRYERNLRDALEHNALVEAGLRDAPLRKVPDEPEVFTEPQWKVRPCYTYDSYEAK